MAGVSLIKRRPSFLILQIIWASIRFSSAQFQSIQMLLSSSTLTLLFYCFSSSPAACFLVFVAVRKQGKRNRKSPTLKDRSGFSELILRVGVVSPGRHLPTLVAQSLGDIGSGTPWRAHLRLANLLFGEDNYEKSVSDAFSGILLKRGIRSSQRQNLLFEMI